MEVKTHYYLMISCPGDVIKERSLLKECVETINNQLNDNSWIELIYWVTDTFSDAGMPAQESINEQLVEKSDGLIAIFNARLGTPVHEYPCGTDEEINLMLKANKHVSLLFNTYPHIDLKNPSSIEQISKLQKYKEEHSSKSFYKEFNDENSFKTVATQEIHMWLRKLKKSNQNIIVLDGGKVVPENSSNTSSEKVVQDDDNIEVVNNPIIEGGIDSQAGPIDCVVYITDSANELTVLFNEYANIIQDFQIKSESFVQNLTFLHKQNNAQGVLLLCKKYAAEINGFSSTFRVFLGNFSSKWKQIFGYLKMLPYNDISQNDKIILKNATNTLKWKFDSAKAQAEEIVVAINSIPRLQKDLDNALKSLKSVFNEYSNTINVAMENCDEIENI